MLRGGHRMNDTTSTYKGLDIRRVALDDFEAEADQDHYFTVVDPKDGASEIWVRFSNEYSARCYIDSVLCPRSDSR